MFKVLGILIRMLPALWKYYWKWLRKYAKHPERYPFEERYARVRELIILICKKMKMELEIENISYLEKMEGNFLITSNHLSMMDPVLVILMSKKPLAIVSKIENKKMPYVKTVLNALECAKVDRKDLRQNAEVLKKVEDDLASGKCSYLIFPEGTRQKNHRAEMHPMHPGSFKLAMKAGVPILPLAQYGTFRLLGKSHGKTNFVQEKFLSPIYREQYEEEGAVDVTNVIVSDIQKEVNALRDVDDAFYLEGRHKNKPEHKDFLSRYNL